MNKFLIKLTLFLSPVLFILLGFFLFDPFKIIFPYKDYSKNMYVILNRDYVSTEVFKNNEAKHHYNSFIFGSSRTIAYKVSEWQKYLDNTAVPFKFDASGETIFGIYTKIKYLQRVGVPLKNVLLIFCGDVTFSKEDDYNTILLIKHPEVAQTSKLHFYTQFFRSYLDPNFLKSYYIHKMTGKFYPFMSGILENRKILFDTISNDMFITDQDNAIKNDPEKYYLEHKNIFYPRKTELCETDNIISAKQYEMLKEIKSIFDQNSTNYKIVISPLYDQKKMNARNMQDIYGIFGTANVFDFSGVNEITADYHNYYETSHYRPDIGAAIMKKIYKTPTSEKPVDK